MRRTQLALGKLHACRQGRGRVGSSSSSPGAEIAQAGSATACCVRRLACMRCFRVVNRVRTCSCSLSFDMQRLDMVSVSVGLCVNVYHIVILSLVFTYHAFQSTIVIPAHLLHPHPRFCLLSHGVPSSSRPCSLSLGVPSSSRLCVLSLGLPSTSPSSPTSLLCSPCP